MKHYIPYPSWWPFRPLGRDIVETITMEPPSAFLLHVLYDENFEELVSRQISRSFYFFPVGCGGAGKSMNYYYYYYYLIYNLKIESGIFSCYFPITGTNLSILSSLVKQTLLVDRSKQEALKKKKKQNWMTSKTWKDLFVKETFELSNIQSTTQEKFVSEIRRIFKILQKQQLFRQCSPL